MVSKSWWDADAGTTSGLAQAKRLLVAPNVKQFLNCGTRYEIVESLGAVNPMFDAKPQVLQIGAGDLVAQYTADDPRMSPLDANKQGVMNISFPYMYLLGGIYYNWKRISPCQVQVVLFDGFDYVSIVQEHKLTEFRQGLTNAIKTATESLGDVDEQVGEALWYHMVNS